MLKVLLVYPPALHAAAPSLPDFLAEEENAGGHFPPLGILGIGTYLSQNQNYRIHLIDSIIEGYTHEEIEKKIREFEPDIVGISLVTWLLYDGITIARTVKKIDANIKVCFGGPHLSVYPRETLLFPETDYIVVGDGEIPFSRLCAALDKKEKKEKIAAIPGVYTKEDAANPDADFKPFIMDDLDVLPHPNRYLLPYEKYRSVFSGGATTTDIVTGRGCPKRCIYCQLADNKSRLRSISHVVDEIETCLAMGIREIELYDDTFNITMRRCEDFSREILKRKLKLTWSFRGIVNAVSADMLKLAKQAGCKRIMYGVEASSDQTLKRIKKGITIEHVKNAFALTKKAGIETFAYFMIGLPGETREDIHKTISFAKALKADYATFSVTTPWPGTEMYRQGFEEKLYEEDYWQNFAKNPVPHFKPRYWDQNFSAAELFQLQQKALKSFYFRPSYLVKQMVKVHSLKDFLGKARIGFKMLREFVTSRLKGTNKK